MWLWQVVDVLNHGTIEVNAHLSLDIWRCTGESRSYGQRSIEIPATIKRLGVELLRDVDVPPVHRLGTTPMLRKPPPELLEEREVRLSISEGDDDHHPLALVAVFRRLRRQRFRMPRPIVHAASAVAVLRRHAAPAEGRAAGELPGGVALPGAAVRQRRSGAAAVVPAPAGAVELGQVVYTLLQRQEAPLHRPQEMDCKLSAWD